MVAKLQKIEAQADDNRKLRVNAGKISRDNCVKCSYNCKFSVVFLSKIAKCKKF
jgi:hypothetical protein